jgi:hypothetical protein
MKTFSKKTPVNLITVLILQITLFYPPAKAAVFTEYSMDQLKKNLAPRPRIFAVVPEANSLTEYTALLIENDVKIDTLPENIVIITHGWNEQTIWFFRLASAVTSKVDNIKWASFFCDWRKNSRILNPVEAAQIAKQKIATKIINTFPQKITKNIRHIHLIAHSAGSWAVTEAAQHFAKTTSADIHITLLDAYVPPFWKETDLADLPPSKNKKYYIEQYFTRDITLYATEVTLTNAHNVDITKIDPTIPDHEFPYHWYTATVINKYFPKTFYAGQKLYHTSQTGTQYGYKRSKQTSQENWKKSLTLKKANQPVILKKNSPITLKSLADYFRKAFTSQDQK